MKDGFSKLIVLTLELYTNGLTEEKEPFLRRSVFGTRLGILYWFLLILPAILKGGNYWSHFILRGLVPCSECTAQLKFKPVQLFSPSLTVHAFLSSWNALLTLSNRLFLIIPSAQPPFPLQNFSWPAVLHYFFSSPQPSHSSLFLPPFPQHSIWDLSFNDKYIHCNFPFTYISEMENFSCTTLVAPSGQGQFLTSECIPQVLPKA